MTAFAEFGSAANKLSKNPLGIIALFIVLLYGIAGLVLGTSADNFHAAERAPLVWFLVLFPLIVLLVFAWLVSCHHQKLYAPGDYKTDDAFLECLSPEVQRRRLEEEVKQVEASEREREDERARAGARPSKIESGIEGAHLVKVAPIRAYARGSMHSLHRAQTVLAEELVLRRLEGEYGVPVRRQAAIKQGDVEIHLDGLAVVSGKPIGVEVNVLREGAYRANLLNRVAEMGATAARLGSVQGASFIAAIVSVGLSAESKQRITKSFEAVRCGIKTPVELRFYDFDELQNFYGISRAS